MGEFAFLSFIILVFMGFPGFLARIAFAFDLNRRASVDQPLPHAKCLHEEVLERGSYSCEEAEKLLCSASLNLTSHFEKFGSVTLTDQNYPNRLHQKFFPKVQYRNRISLIQDISRQGLKGYGAELGVAKGSFSRAILSNSKFKRVFSIDAWESGTRYHRRRSVAVKALNKYSLRSCVIWGFFSNAKDLFGDHTLDFVYIDGFASDGELEGQTFEEFYPKVRSGGVFGGHDYDKRFPLVQEAVQRFVEKHGLQIHIIPGAGTTWDCCDSWFVVVP